MLESYGTLSETINGLNKDGYTLDFNVNKNCVICNHQNISLSPEDFEIDKVYRFEGETNPDDQAILYAISSTKFNVKGVLVNGYGISSDEKSNALIAKLKTHVDSFPHHESVKNVDVQVRLNEATELRPEGDRILDAPFVEMDINKFIDQIKNETTWGTADHNSITIFKSNNTTIVLIGMHSKAELKKHKVYKDIYVQVLEGKIDFCTEQHSVSLQKGQMIALKAGIEHSVQSLDESFFLLTVSVSGNS